MKIAKEKTIPILQSGRFWLLLAIIITPLATYGVLHYLVSAMPDMYQGYTLGPVLMVMFIIALTLAVPYWLLKGVFSVEHKRNYAEDELRMSDMPKSQDEVSKPRA